MKNKLLHILFASLFLIGNVYGQLSPGDLSNPHKELEGVANCTKCHDIGNKVSNTKCLSCHKEIKSQVDANRGFHVSQEVKGNECAKCHNEHHGRKFDMVRFDEKKFDHNLTGFELTGRHKSGWSSKGEKIDCRSCHKPDFIDDQETKKRPETFLGLHQQCNSCHKDKHQKTLGNDCAKCHNTEEFRPAPKFNHDKSEFPLAGKHKNVQCIECHKKEQRNGEEFQRFADVPFKNCNSCHDDPHKNNLGTNCKECHNEQGFDALAGLSKFNHAKTEFPLKGKHRQVDCKECHKILAATPATVFQDRLGVKTQDCKTCHKDVHDGRFGANCAECHHEDGFGKLHNLDKFDHNRTDFALKGKHEVVDCKKCHVSESMTDPLPHNSCASCHKDYHEGQFLKNSLSPDCAECHSVDGFDGSSFSIEQHAKTKFALDGAHAATPCLACHKKEEKWKFRGIGERCVDCHKDIHEGQIDQKWYANNSCDNCHLPSSWRENHFDHSKTAFKLQGVHTKQECRDCHVPDDVFKHGKFAGLSAACSDCHEDQHNRQFEQNGKTDCARCHNFENWEMSSFDHSKTRFKLEGKHAKVDCAACHKSVVQGDKTLTQYKFDNIECIVCHR